jgi:hypothetical protein
VLTAMPAGAVELACVWTADVRLEFAGAND